MAKRLFLMGCLLLMLIIGFTLVPSHIAHADECNACGQDPVLAGCTYSQYIIWSYDFPAGGDTWEIRLRSSHSQSPACSNKVWASLVLKYGNNPTLFNSQDIQVYSQDGIIYDILPSSQFQSGAYTNMIPYIGNFACAQYDGNGLYPPPAACTP